MKRFASALILGTLASLLGFGLIVPQHSAPVAAASPGVGWLIESQLVSQVAARTDFIPRGDVILYQAGGKVRSWVGTSTTLRGTALITALAAAVSGDVIHLGPGTFAGGSSVFDVPSGVSLIGSGDGVTTLTTTSSSKTCVCPGDNSLIQNLTISVGSGGYPLGSVLAGSQKTSTGAVFRGVKTVGGIDGIIYTHTASTCTFTAYDCEFVSGWDTCYVRNCVAKMFNCIFDANPSFGAGSFGFGAQTNGPQTNDASADITVIGGKVRVAGGSSNNRGALCTLGVIRMSGVLIDSSGTGAVDLSRAGGTLYANGISTPTGIAPSTSGTITWADTVAGTKPGSSGLTALAATSAANLQTAAGTVIGTNVQAYDATLAAVAAYNTNGILTQTAADTFTGRTITGTANQVTVTNGDGVAGNPTLSLPSSVFPTRHTFWPHTDTVTVGNALVGATPSGSGTLFSYWTQSTPAVNNERTNGCMLRAGTYTLTIWYYRINSAAIMTVYIDGVSQGTLDMYNAVAAANSVATMSVTVVGDGYHKITLKANSKNASSTNYNMFLHVYDLKPSAD